MRTSNTNQPKQPTENETQTQPQPTRPVQPELFALNGRGELTLPVADIPALTPSSSLDVARWWFKRHLEQLRRPINTIDSYMYDLAIFQQTTSNRRLDKINTTDIANFLGQANKK